MNAMRPQLNINGPEPTYCNTGLRKSQSTLFFRDRKSFMAQILDGTVDTQIKTAHVLWNHTCIQNR